MAYRTFELSTEEKQPPQNVCNEVTFRVFFDVFD